MTSRNATPSSPDATSKAFAAVTSAPNDPAAELKGLTRAAAERRLLLFSARPAEQSDLAQTEIAGQLGDDSGAPTVGVFRNDATGGKLGYYATGSARLTSDSCRDPARAMNLRVSMQSTAPASGLSPYVLGLAKAGPYVLRTNVVLTGPVGGRLDDIEVGGKVVPVARGVQDGHPAAMVTVDLPPGASTEVTATVGLRAVPATAVTPRACCSPPGCTPGRPRSSRSTPAAADSGRATRCYVPCAKSENLHRVDDKAEQIHSFGLIFVILCDETPASFWLQRWERGPGRSPSFIRPDAITTRRDPKVRIVSVLRRLLTVLGLTMTGLLVGFGISSAADYVPAPVAPGGGGSGPAAPVAGAATDVAGHTLSYTGSGINVGLAVAIGVLVLAVGVVLMVAGSRIARRPSAR